MDRRHLRHLGRLARIFWAYRGGAARVPQLPVRLWIESTSRCNLRCGYCPNKDVAKEDHGFMDFGLYTSIIDQVASHAYDVNLFHRGEPLMHPRLADMVAYARDKGLYTRVHTNITLLNEKKGRALIESGNLARQQKEESLRRLDDSLTARQQRLLQLEEDRKAAAPEDTSFLGVPAGVYSLSVGKRRLCEIKITSKP